MDQNYPLCCYWMAQMNQWEWGFFGLFIILIIIASGIAGVLRALAGIAGDLGKIYEEIQGLRHDLYRERHPRDERDPFA